MRRSERSGKKVCILGSAGFIGSYLSAHLRSQGYDVVGFDLANGYDLTEPGVTSEILASQRFDVLLNCFAMDQKGWADGQSFIDFDSGDALEFFAVNVVSTYEACVEFIRRQQGGFIVNFSSVYADSIPSPGIYNGGDKTFAYGASKAAVEYMTRYLAKHAGPNFRVTCLRLGGVENRLLPDDFRCKYLSRSLSSSMVNLEEVAVAVDLLINPASKSLTGEILSITGGFGE